MKASAFFSMRVNFFLIALGLVVSGTCMPLTSPIPQPDEQVSSEAVAFISRYQVNKAYQQKFMTALGDYVNSALSIEQNIMAEAFSEQENPTVLWVIERWTNTDELNKYHRHSLFKAIEVLSKKALAQPVKVIQINDLEPISKSEWRKEAAPGESPIVIMLFVDSKAGTEENFKSVYHTAMPQFRSEPGVINYQLSQLNEDKTQFVTYEKFRDEDAFQYHLDFPPIKPVIEYLNTSIKQQPFQTGLHRLNPIPTSKR
jgi:quinol monooxygenase YgiN